MLRKFREAQEEEGFTLIELLVVVIIIGILAAIAIPVFLNQRRKAWDSAVKSDLRNAATAQETYLTDYDVYATTYTALETAAGFNKSADVVISNVVAYGADGYCMQAHHVSNTAKTWFMYSATGEPQTGTC